MLGAAYRSIPSLGGAALAVMLGIGPNEAELNFCEWVNKITPVEARCLYSVPSEALWSIAFLLISGGTIWLLWPYRRKIMMIEPIHLIILGWLIFTIGIGWHVFQSKASTYAVFAPHQSAGTSRIAELQKENDELRQRLVNSSSPPVRDSAKYNKAQIGKIVEAIDALYSPLLNIERIVRSGLGASGSLEGNIRQRGPTETIRLLDNVRLQLNPETARLNNTIAEYGLYKEAVGIVDGHKQFHDRFFATFNKLMSVLRETPDSLSDNVIRNIIKDKNDAFAEVTKSYFEWAQQKKKELEDNRERFLKSDTAD